MRKIKINDGGGCSAYICVKQRVRPKVGTRRFDGVGRLPQRRLLCLAAITAVGLLSNKGVAASGSWTGTTDVTWNGNNWSATPAPGTGDTATFNGAGNSNTKIDLGTGITVNNVLFDTSSAAAYNIGIGAVGSQALTINDGGSITLNASVVQNESFNAGIVLGVNASAAAYAITNNNPTYNLSFLGNFTGGPVGGTAGTKTLTFGGVGSTTIGGSLILGNASNIALTKFGTGALTFNGTTNAAILGSGATGGAYGTVTVNNGTLTLDFSNFGASGNANLLNSFTPVTLGGGTLQIIGNATNASTQSFNNGSGVTANPGLNVITVGPNAGNIANPLPTLNLGAFTQNLGSQTVLNGPAYSTAVTVSIASPPGGAPAVTPNVAATGTTTTTTVGQGNKLLRSAADLGVATVGLYNWASELTTAGTNSILSGDQVANFYVQIANAGTIAASNTNYDLLGSATALKLGGTGSFKATAFLDTIRFNVPGAFTFTTATTATNAITELSGILVTPNVGANNTTIANGGTFLSPGNGGGAVALDVYQNNNAGELLISAPFFNAWNGTNFTAEVGSYVQGGAGTVLLTGQGASDGQTGATYLTGGTTVINDPSQLGKVSTNATLNLNGGTVLGSATSLSLGTRAVALAGNGGGLASVTGNTMTVGGVVSGAAGTGPLVIGIPASSANQGVAGLLPGTGSISPDGLTTATANPTGVYGTGIVALTGANTYTGGTTVLAGATLNISGINALGGANYGGLTLNNGMLQYATAFTGNGSGDLTSIGTAGVTIASGGGTIDTNGNAVTYAGSIGNSGLGVLTVKSSVAGGTLTLGGANTYKGGTTISSGTLNVTNTTGSATGTGSVALNGGTLAGSGIITGTVNASGGAIAPAGTSLSLGGLTYTSGNLNFNINGTTASATKISTASATFNATPTFGALTLIGASSITNGQSYTVFQSTSPIAAPGGVLSTAALNAQVQTIGRFTFTPAEVGTTSIVFNVTGGNPANLIWAGGVAGLSTTVASEGNGSTWNDTQNNSASNWNNAGKYDYFYDADNVTFNDTANSGNHVINLTTANPAGSVTVTTASSYTFGGTGSISGVASLNVSSGTLNLNTTNTYTGGTLILTGGKLVTGGGALPAGGSVTLQGTGTLDLNGTSQSIGSLSSGGSTTALITDGVSTASSLTTGGSATTTYGGIIQNGAGQLALTVAGSGSLALTNSNTYGGGTTLSAGTLLINNGSPAATGASAIGTGALNLSGGSIDTSIAGFVLGTNNPITISGSFAFGGTNSMNLGTGAVSLATNSTITLAGTGKTFIFGGVATNPTAAAVTTTVNLSPTGSGNTLVLGGLALTSGGTALNDVFSGNANINILGPVTDGSGAGSGLTYSGTGTVTLFGSNTYTGPTTITGGASLTATQGTLVIPAGASLTSTSSLTVGPGAVLSITGGTVSLPSVASNPYSLFQTGGNGTNIYISSGALTYGNNAAADPNTALIGKFTQTGGTVVTAESNISPNAGNASQLNLLGGTYTSNPGLFASFTVGTRGDGKVFVDGGSLTVNGTTTTPATTDINQLIVGAQYSGSNASKNHWLIEQSGSVTTNGLVLGAMSTAAITGTSGLYYLNGGTLTTNTLTLGTEGAAKTTGTFYFGGGTFNSGTSFSTDANVVTMVNSGGATINTSGGSLTWSGALQAGVTGTVNGFTGLTGGSGYFPAPTVTVSNPDTTGATAQASAVINAQGQLVDVIITNPGSGYTTAPTFTITPAAGGTGSGASAMGVSPLTAVGGLTKRGANSLTLASGNDTYTGPTNVVAGTLVISQNGSLPSGNNLTVGAGATLVDVQNSVLSSTSSAGSVNVNGSLIIQGSPGLQSVTTAVANGYANGKWNNSSSGTIYSSAAANDPAHLHALGVIQNDNGTGTQLYSSFEGSGTLSLNDSDVLVKNTYYGDTDLNGEVDGSDYSRIDSAYLYNQTASSPLTGWFNGDFNYDGVIDGSDYTLIDNAFNTQGADISSQIASPSAVATSLIAGAGTSAVPEPTTLGLLGIGVAGLLGRRRLLPGGR